jgi:hypothetical protein
VKVQDYLAAETMRSMEGMIRLVSGMAEDKVIWSALEEGRTALDQVAECALICESLLDVIPTRQMPDFTPEMVAEYEASKKAMSMDQAVHRLRAATSALGDLIGAFPDGELESTMKFWGPEPWRMVDVLGYHNWNMTYHVGQINFIQTLYGDKQMG